MNINNPYLVGLAIVKKHPGTSGQAAMAMCILSLYNWNHSYSIGEILAPLDSKNKAAALAMVSEYAYHGETAELREAGEWVFKNFPGLVELSNAMYGAKCEIRQKWKDERDAEVRRRCREEEL